MVATCLIPGFRTLIFKHFQFPNILIGHKEPNIKTEYIYDYVTEHMD